MAFPLFFTMHLRTAGSRVEVAMTPALPLGARAFFMSRTGGPMTTRRRRIRILNRWQSKPERDATAGRPSLSPREILATRSQADGGLCGPYENSYAIDDGYPTELRVSRP
jgi:hypothetical protein